MGAEEAGGRGILPHGPQPGHCEALSDMLWAGGVGFSSALVLQLTGTELGFG